MTIHEAQQQLLFQLYHIYDNREAASIADWVMEKLTGWKKIDRIINKKVPLLPDQITQLESYTEALLQHKPVQYVLQEAWFGADAYFVDERVLIPRPETEELVEWVIQDNTAAGNIAILDIGTGSGCIPISLRKKLPAASINACDISAGALDVARQNATVLQASVEFLELDILNSDRWTVLPALDIIVSNPPYIPQKDKATMFQNVLSFEPHLALFVEDDDPLLFYRTIAILGKQQLLPGGKIYVEIHEDLGMVVCELFTANGYRDVTLKKDLQGKDRMVRAVV